MGAEDGERELLRQTVEDMLAGHCTPARVAAAAAGSGWDEGLWQALEETGLTLAGSPEEAGGGEQREDRTPAERLVSGGEAHRRATCGFGAAPRSGRA